MKHKACWLIGTKNERAIHRKNLMVCLRATGSLVLLEFIVHGQFLVAVVFGVVCRNSENFIDPMVLAKAFVEIT